MTTPLDTVPDEFIVNRRVSHAGNMLLPQFVLDCLGAEAGALETVHPDAQGRARALHALMKTGTCRVLDRAVADPRPNQGIVVLSIPCLGLDDVVVEQEIIERFPSLLDGGCWALLDLRYKEGHQLAGRSYPFAVTNVELIRTVLGSPQKFAQAIGKLEPAEWERILLESIGFRPEAFDPRQRLLLLSRLAPLVEPNLHLVELAQPGTGKTTTLAATSPRAIVKAGGTVSLPELFKNLRTGLPGLVARYDVVAFDEIQHLDVTGNETVTAALKEYLEMGTYTRGGVTSTSPAGLVLMGNIPLKHGQPDRSLPHHFSVFPRPLQDVALFDRLHGALPGWEMPTIEPGLLHGGKAIALDILAEHFHHQRASSHADRVASAVEWNPGMTQRDLRAVSRLSSALLKLRFPKRGWDDANLFEIVSFACELRQRVYNQMVAARPEQFEHRLIGFAGMHPHTAPDVMDPLQRGPIIALSEARVGSILGLAARDDLASGEVFAIEAALVPGGRGIDLTGLHGQMLRDSARAARTFLTTHATELGFPQGLLRSHRLHIHIERAWERREGPSAGAAIAAVMMSAVSNRPARTSVAITGALSLHGDVLGVGAVPAKIVAAYRHGCASVLVPRANAEDLNQVPPQVAANINMILVDRIEEVFGHALLPMSS